MPRFILLLLFVSFSQVHLSAQCPPECPPDQEVLFELNQFDSLYLPPANLNSCTESLFYTLRGPTYAAGEKNIQDARIRIGTYQLEYVNSQHRFGNFPPEPVPLPDGDGAVYEAPITVDLPDDPANVFLAGGLTQVCLLMEHSYLGDLDILVRCPSGETQSLHEYDPTDDVAGQTLGEGTEASITPDPFGLYCWTLSASNTMAEYVSGSNVGDNEPLPSVDYLPTGSFSAFNPCPAEGEWTIVVRDNIPRDQGFIGGIFLDFGQDNFSACQFNIEVTFETSVNTPDPNIANLFTYPNPTNNQFTLNFEASVIDQAQLTVYAANGTKSYQQSIRLQPGTNIHQLESADWPAGVYTLRLATSTGERWTRIVRL